MECVKMIDAERFPKQGLYLGKKVRVRFHYDTSRWLMGFVVRDDAEEPRHTIIKLEDGRHVLASECQYEVYPVEDEPNTNFEVASMTLDERRLLVEEWERCAITFEEMRAGLRKAGVATEDDAKAKEKIASEKGGGIQKGLTTKDVADLVYKILEVEGLVAVPVAPETKEDDAKAKIASENNGDTQKCLTIKDVEDLVYKILEEETW